MTIRRGVVPAAVLVLVALCLRGPFAAVGPVVEPLERETGLSTTALAVLTATPLVVFGLLSPVAPSLGRRCGLHRAVLLGLVVLAAGVLLRAAAVPGLFLGTVVLSAGIAVVNVLLPAVVRAEYGAGSAPVLGAVTGCIALSASVGAVSSAPAAEAVGGAQDGLVLWALPVGACVGAMWLLARRRAAVTAAARSHGRLRDMLADPVAAAVSAFFGLQALMFYTMLTWLPRVLQDEAHLSPSTSGVLVAVAAFLGAPAAFVVPRLVTRTPGQSRWTAAVAAPTAVALLGLLLAPAAAPALWAVLYGCGTGAAFPLAMTLVLTRTGDPQQTGRLSAVAQSSGYLLAATGPLALGVLHDVTGGWDAGLWLVLGLLGAQVAVGVSAGRPRTVGAA